MLQGKEEVNPGKSPAALRYSLVRGVDALPAAPVGLALGRRGFPKGICLEKPPLDT